MKTIATAAALIMTAATASSATTSGPDVRNMAAIAYRIPAADVEAGLASLRADMGLAHGDDAAALATLAACGKSGAVEFRDLIRAMPSLAPAWKAAYRHPDVERTFSLHVDGVTDLSRLCTSVETARMSHGDTASTIRDLVTALTSDDASSRIARAMIRSSVPPAIRSDAIRRDYLVRISQSAD